MERNVDPAESLQIIRETLAKVRRHLSFGTGPVYRTWGLAWIAGFAFTDMVVRGPLRGVIAEGWIGAAWIAITGLAGLYTYRYFRRQPVETDARRRFLLGWLAAFTLMGLTVGSTGAAGLPLHGVQFAAFAIFTAAVIYIVTGAILLDNVQAGVGAWLGLANVISLQLGPDSYLLAVALLGGGGLVVAGFLDDRANRVRGEKR